MNDLSQKLEVGHLLIIETGEYSDRSWAGPVRVIKAFTKQAVADLFRNEWKPTEAYHKEQPSSDEFLPWLIARGYVEDVEWCDAWHVGSYGEFEP